MKENQNNAVVELRDELVVEYIGFDNKQRQVCVNIGKNDSVTVLFDKENIVVSNGIETKFIVKRKQFIALWVQRY